MHHAAAWARVVVFDAREAMPDGGRLTIEAADLHLSGSETSDDLEVAGGACVMLAVADTRRGWAR